MNNCLRNLTSRVVPSRKNNDSDDRLSDSNAFSAGSAGFAGS